MSLRTEDVPVFRRQTSPQPDVDELEERTLGRYRDRRPLAMYRQLRDVVEDARRTADARGRLDSVLERQRAAESLAGRRR